MLYTILLISRFACIKAVTRRSSHFSQYFNFLSRENGILLINVGGSASNKNGKVGINGRDGQNVGGADLSSNWVNEEPHFCLLIKIMSVIK